MAEKDISFERKNLKHNIIANMGDGSIFGFAFGFSSFSTVIPLFVATMTNSATLIGLIPAIHAMGWQLPQLFTAKLIKRKQYIKPYVVQMTIQERLPFLGLAIIGLLLPKIGNTSALVLTFLVLIWQGLGSGLTANAWQIMISKVIPGEFRSTFYGSQAAGSNLLASIGAILAGIILSKISSPYSFATCFFIASALYVISWFFLNSTREPQRLIEKSEENPVSLWKDVHRILRLDHQFRSFIISRIVSQFGMMAFAFYTVYAVKILQMDTVAIGVMTGILMITQVIANPLLGRIADLWSRKWVMVLGGIASVISAILAILIKNPTLFSLVFILFGIAATCYWTIGLAISLEFGNEKDRPTYVGMSNTLIAPATIIAPLVGGLLADSFGYPVTFITSAVFGMIAVITLGMLVKDPAKATISG
jgi:MFS family permease